MHINFKYFTITYEELLIHLLKPTSTPKSTCVFRNSWPWHSSKFPATPMGYSIIVLYRVWDVGSENHSKISGHITSGEREFLIPVAAGFWRELWRHSCLLHFTWIKMANYEWLNPFMFTHISFYGHSLKDEEW